MYHNYRLNTPIKGDYVYRTRNPSKAVNYCYEELCRKINCKLPVYGKRNLKSGTRSNKFSIIDLTNKSVIYFKQSGGTIKKIPKKDKDDCKQLEDKLNKQINDLNLEITELKEQLQKKHLKEELDKQSSKVIIKSKSKTDTESRGDDTRSSLDGLKAFQELDNLYDEQIKLGKKKSKGDDLCVIM